MTVKSMHSMATFVAVGLVEPRPNVIVGDHFHNLLMERWKHEACPFCELTRLLRVTMVV